MAAPQTETILYRRHLPKGTLPAVPKLIIDLPPSVSEREVRLVLALELYKQGHISLGKAAEMVGYPLREFMRVASGRGTAVINYDPAEQDSPPARRILQAARRRCTHYCGGYR